MTSTIKHTHHHVDVAELAPSRITADVVQRWGATLAVVLCALQFAFAALGFWGGVLGGGSEEVTRAAFAPHTVNGDILGWLSVALLICGLVSRVSWRSWVLPLVCAVLTLVVQGTLVGLGFGVSKWFGFLHALDGALITAGLVWLMIDCWSRRGEERAAMRAG